MYQNSSENVFVDILWYFEQKLKFSNKLYFIGLFILE